MDDREWQTFVTVVDEGEYYKGCRKIIFITTSVELSVAPYGKALSHSLLLRTAGRDCSYGTRRNFL